MPRKIWTRRLRGDAPPELPITTEAKVLERHDRLSEFKDALYGSDTKPTGAQPSQITEEQRKEYARLVREYHVEMALLESQTAVTQEDGTVETLNAEERKNIFDDKLRSYKAEVEARRTAEAAVKETADNWSLLLHAVARRVRAESTA
mmetsp:Transcript_79225/g.222121  ORF Transcript_79225/g.222121 Transcript_79225/m.222121 type:complete len:148 (+) Transcript_79225:69-512(+)